MEMGRVVERVVSQVTNYLVSLQKILRRGFRSCSLGGEPARRGRGWELVRLYSSLFLMT